MRTLAIIAASGTLNLCLAGERTMRSGWASILGSGAMALLGLHPALAQEGATTRDREAMPPKVANRTVQRDLLSVLEPVTRIDSGMFRQLRGVGLTTNPFGTEFDGLCRRDAVTLWYAATGTAAKPEDAPLRPYSVEAQPWFHIIHPPREASSDARRGEGVWQAKCASATTSEDARWFAAKDARTAIQGSMMLEAAVKAVRSGALKAEPCPNIFDPKEATCESTILAHGDLSKIDSVETCSSEDGSLCYVVDLASSIKMTIKGRASENSLTPSAVTSIAVEQYITVT